MNCAGRDGRRGEFVKEERGNRTEGKKKKKEIKREKEKRKRGSVWRQIDDG